MPVRFDFPPTVLVVHPKEKRSKCSVEPLRGSEGFHFLEYPPEPFPDLAGYVRVGLGGPMLSVADARCGLLFLDGPWRLTEKMEPDFAHLSLRSLPNWRTAYPRVSKLRPDPEEQLATIEAIYVAYHRLGRPTDGLLDEYRWGEEFLRINTEPE